MVSLNLFSYFRHGEPASVTETGSASDSEPEPDIELEPTLEQKQALIDRVEGLINIASARSSPTSQPRPEAIAALLEPSLPMGQGDWADFCHTGQAILEVWCLLANATYAEAAEAKTLYAWRCRAIFSFAEIEEVAILSTILDLVTLIDFRAMVPLSDSSRPRSDHCYQALQVLKLLQKRRWLPMQYERDAPAADGAFGLNAQSSPGTEIPQPLESSELLRQVWPPIPNGKPGAIDSNKCNLAAWHSAIKHWVEENKELYRKQPNVLETPYWGLHPRRSLTRPNMSVTAAQSRADRANRASSAPAQSAQRPKPGQKRTRTADKTVKATPAAGPAHQSAKRRKVADKTYRPEQTSPPTSPYSPTGEWAGRTRASTPHLAGAEGKAGKGKK